jgi:hypothetical protein
MGARFLTFFSSSSPVLADLAVVFLFQTETLNMFRFHICCPNKVVLFSTLLEKLFLSPWFIHVSRVYFCTYRYNPLWPLFTFSSLFCNSPMKMYLAMRFCVYGYLIPPCIYILYANFKWTYTWICSCRLEFDLKDHMTWGSHSLTNVLQPMLISWT